MNQWMKAIQQSGNDLLQIYGKDYIAIHPQAKQLILKPKSVLFLCQHAIAKVEPLTNLEPDATEGLIALIQHQKVQAKFHFTPEQIIINGDVVEGRLRLLNQPQFETNSFLYRTLISGWQTFLGGHIPNRALPEGVRVEGNYIYYQLPKAQLKLLDLLFHNLEDGSALNLCLQQGELQISSAIAVNWHTLNLQGLLQLFKSSPSS